MSGQMYYTKLRGGTPEEGTPGSMPFFGSYLVISNSYSGLGFD